MTRSILPSCSDEREVLDSRLVEAAERHMIVCSTIGGPCMAWDSEVARLMRMWKLLHSTKLEGRLPYHLVDRDCPSTQLEGGMLAWRKADWID